MNNPAGQPPLLRARALEKRYRQREGWRTKTVVALRDVNLEVHCGSAVAIIGDSGSGKTTLARCVSGMERVDGGSLVFNGLELAGLSQRAFRRIRSQVQLIFQDPSMALNPSFTAEELIAEPLRIQHRGTPASNAERVVQLMGEVGLPVESRHRRPREFSGGQLQRIAIARALAIEPRLLILDEAFTGLDLSTAAQIANLLLDLRAKHDLTYLVISHDLGLAARFADWIAVMESGTIVECGPPDEVLTSPLHGSTRRLVEASAAMHRAFAMAAGEGA